jgi:hypothetical protein
MQVPLQHVLPNIGWSERNNGNPEDASSNRFRRYWFVCLVCKHEVSTSLSHIRKPNWCQYCKCKKLCTNVSCQFCHEKSFAANPVAEYWLPENAGRPRDFRKGSMVIKWFICDREGCGHRFQIKLRHIENGRWCPRCEYNDPMNPTKHSVSFANPENEYLWLWARDKNIADPEFVSADSTDSHLFRCAVWADTPYNISRGYRRFRCKCYSVTAVVKPTVDPPPEDLRQVDTPADNSLWLNFEEWLDVDGGNS